MRRNSGRIRLLIIGQVVLFLVGGVVRASDFAPLADEIRKLATASKLGTMRVGVSVLALGPKPTVVYELRADESLKPASNQKIITGAALLALLGENFAYRTILAQRGDDLIIVGSGDPSIGDPRLAEAAGESIYAIFDRWADELKKRNMTTIKGDLLFDDFMFDDQRIPPSWKEQHNLDKWYTAGVGALNFNDNCVDVVVAPAKTKGEPAIVRLIPDTPWVQLKNTTKTASKGEPLVHRTGSGPITITVSQSVSKANDPKHPISVPVPDPGALFASTCRTILATRGIKIVGETRRQQVCQPGGTLPTDVNVVAIHETRPIDIMWRLNKSSQNLFAEAFLKSLGAYATPDGKLGVGSYESGRSAARRFLNGIGVATDRCVIDDGCGLSHSNRTTARALSTVLAYMDTQPPGDRWRESLAQPGEQEGTLRRRMKSLKGVVFAKTGYINNVSALSGYVVAPAERRFAFSILCNDTQRAKGGVAAAKALEDAICQTLAAWNPKPPAR